MHLYLLIQKIKMQNSAKIDKMLDDYEAMITEYDKYVTKLKSGDVDMESAMNMATKSTIYAREFGRNGVFYEYKANATFI